MARQGTASLLDASVDGGGGGGDARKGSEESRGSDPSKLFFWAMFNPIDSRMYGES
jgi:hypothetical protein